MLTPSRAPVSITLAVAAIPRQLLHGVTTPIDPLPILADPPGWSSMNRVAAVVKAESSSETACGVPETQQIGAAGDLIGVVQARFATPT